MNSENGSPVASTPVHGVTGTPLLPSGVSNYSCMLCSSGNESFVALCTQCAFLSDKEIIAKYSRCFADSLADTPITQSHADCVINTIALRCDAQSQSKKNFLAGINGTFPW